MSDENMTGGEVIQFLNPAIQPVMEEIMQIAMQPQMTSKDEERLRHYKTETQKHRAPFSPQNHLFKIKFDDNEATYRAHYATDPIQYNEIIAITYAWHETQEKRAYTVLRENGAPLKLELGEEWHVEPFLQTLAELSNTYWIWMDQFSLVQDDDLTETLSRNIPEIYRSVRVVAFLPYKVCERLSRTISDVREDAGAKNVGQCLADFLLHDLVCECTDGIYGWLSRLWTWQELMLATSLQFVWGLGQSQWTTREVLNKGKSKEEPEEEDSFWAKTKRTVRKIKTTVKHTFTDTSIPEQPLTKLLNELIKRNTESVIIDKKDTATLSMGYYFCLRLLCGAEIYMPSASRTSPINCLKVLQQIADTGRKGGRVYDCYYAAAAFIEHPTFLPNKKKTILEQNEQNEAGDLEDETVLRNAYVRLYEHEHARLRLPDKFQDMLNDPEKLLQEYTELYTTYYDQSPDLKDKDNAALQRDFVDLYHDVNHSTLVKYTGAPVPNVNSVDDALKENYCPIAWKQNTHSQRSFVRLISNSDEHQENQAYVSQDDIRGKFPNAFILSGMQEEAFCETNRDGTFCGTAYNISSIGKIKVGRIQDLSVNSIYKIIKNLHPSQLTRVRNFNSIPTGVRARLFPLAHAIVHAASFKAKKFPAHLVETVSTLLGSRTTQGYVDAVTMILGGSFDFISDKHGETQKNQFRLAKIKFSDGTRCVGIISSLMKDFLAEQVSSQVNSKYGKSLVKALEKPIRHWVESRAVKVVKSHHRLLLCAGDCVGELSNWSIVGYIPGFDADANEAALGPISHSEVNGIKQISVE
ncbi:hypothetical protein DVH05_016609 [Phytophthora capsici]|nr:hypothetical protein DVH05_016609 [Phytophthora capsici]